MIEQPQKERLIQLMQGTSVALNSASVHDIKFTGHKGETLFSIKRNHYRKNEGIITPITEKEYTNNDFSFDSIEAPNKEFNDMLRKEFSDLEIKELLIFWMYKYLKRNVELINVSMIG